MPERVLVTGGAGYIGAVLVPYLLNEGYAVRVLDRFSHSSPTLMSCIGHEGFEPVRGDCRDVPTLRAALQGVDWIIPLAAIVGAPACERDSLAATSTNHAAITDLLHWRSKEQRVLFPNTNSGYGTTPPGEVTTENTPLKPISLYGITKAEAERTVLFKENTCAFRLATVFGPSPRMRLDLLVNDFVYRALKDKALVLYEPHFRRNYMHVYDVSRLFVFAMRNFEALKGKPWNAGLHYCLTKQELCQEIQKSIPDFRFFVAETNKDPDKRDYEVSVQRLENLGFKCCVSLSRGIRELKQAYEMLPGPEFTNL